MTGELSHATVTLRASNALKESTEMLTIDCPICDEPALVDGALTALDCPACGQTEIAPDATPALDLAA